MNLKLKNINTEMQNLDLAIMDLVELWFSPQYLRLAKYGVLKP